MSLMRRIECNVDDAGSGLPFADGGELSAVNRELGVRVVGAAAC